MPILNILWKGSANILLALSVDGAWFWMILNESNTHFTFWIFLFFLQNYVRLVWRNINFPIKTMLDNASIHLTRQTMNLAQYLKMELHYLLPYWPHLAPIELIFGALKKRITALKLEETIDFAKPSGKKMIIECMRLIGVAKWRNMWTHFVKEAKRAIIKITEKENDAWILLHTLNDIGQNPKAKD